MLSMNIFTNLIIFLKIIILLHFSDASYQYDKMKFIKMLGFKCTNLYMYLCLSVGEGDLIIPVSRSSVTLSLRL